MGNYGTYDGDQELMELTHDELVHETDEAVLFKFDNKKYWIPKSLIGAYDDATVEVPEWYAEQEELEEYEL